MFVTSKATSIRASNSRNIDPSGSRKSCGNLDFDLRVPSNNNNNKKVGYERTNDDSTAATTATRN